ncbi:MAG: hypothetical protein ACI81T_004543 [Bacteroidia bacterium]|jgi:hypothetical protein
MTLKLQAGFIKEPQYFNAQNPKTHSQVLAKFSVG